MKIQDILFRNSVLIDLKPADKKEIVTLMGRFLASVYNLKDPLTLVQKLLEREASVSTGIGFGIAIPHVRLDSIDQITLVCARCPEGIEFDSLDEKPVHLIFMLACPTDRSDELRNLLSSLSKIMSYEDMRDKLVDASEPEEFIELLIEGENKYAST